MFDREAVEDLTGGVTTEIFTCDIMDTDLYWKEGISLTNKDFLFAAWIVPTSGFNSNRRGIVKGHGSHAAFSSPLDPSERTCN